MPQKSVGIVLLTYNGMRLQYNGEGIINRCLRYLAKTDYDNFHVVVVDNGSEDNSIEIIKKYKVDLISIKENLYNFSIVNNRGIKYLKSKYNPDYYVLISNDVFTTDKNWLKELVKVSESDKRIGVIGPKLLWPNKTIQSAGVYGGAATFNRWRGEKDNKKYNIVDEMPVILGACIMIRKEVFDKIGLLDDNYAMGSEEVDLCLRAAAADFKIVYDGNAQAIHLERFTQKRRGKSVSFDLRRFYYAKRNFVYHTKKHFWSYGASDKAKALFDTYFGSFLTIDQSKRGMAKLFSIRKDKPVSNAMPLLKATVDGLLMNSKLKPAKRVKISDKNLW